MSVQLEYDVCFSFAGEDRDYVRAVAENLTSAGVSVFYDEFVQVELWGKDLYTHLDHVYRNAARFCVLFISEAYAKKLWTNHERQSAQARAFVDNEEYILPVRFDDSEIPGLRPTVGYLDARSLSPAALAQRIQEKTGSKERENYLPPTFDVLQSRLGIITDEDAIRLFEHRVRGIYEKLPEYVRQRTGGVVSFFYQRVPNRITRKRPHQLGSATSGEWKFRAGRDSFARRSPFARDILHFT